MVSQRIKVTFRGNDGADGERAASDMADAERIAKLLRTTERHMVCIVSDGAKVKRWDRAKLVGENRWRKVDVHAIQTLGPIRQVIAVRR